MDQLRECRYENCYFNNNIENKCLRESITVGFTGGCETLQHCDENECFDCERFDVCKKLKKQNFLKNNKCSE